jgi:hypothetical protein
VESNRFSGAAGREGVFIPGIAGGKAVNSLAGSLAKISIRAVFFILFSRSISMHGSETNEIEMTGYNLYIAPGSAHGWQEWIVVTLFAVIFSAVSRCLQARAEQLAKQQGLHML